MPLYLAPEALPEPAVINVNATELEDDGIDLYAYLAARVHRTEICLITCSMEDAQKYNTTGLKQMTDEYRINMRNTMRRAVWFIVGDGTYPNELEGCIGGTNQDRRNFARRVLSELALAMHELQETANGLGIYGELCGELMMTKRFRDAYYALV